MNSSTDIARAFVAAIEGSGGEGPKDDNGAALDAVVPLDGSSSVGLTRNTSRNAWMLWVERDLDQMSDDAREEFLDTLVENTAVTRLGRGQVTGMTSDGRLAIYNRLPEAASAIDVDAIITASLTLLMGDRSSGGGTGGGGAFDPNMPDDSVWIRI